MADFGIAEGIALAGVVAAAGTTAYSVNAQKKIAEKAKSAVPLPLPIAKPADESGLNADKRKRQMAAAADMGGTLLTGPQGVTGPAPTASKTLLGQ